MKKILPLANAVIAVIAGVLVLLGYFFEGVFKNIQSVLVGWAIILAAFALLLGVINLAKVHWMKVSAGGKASIYSVVLLVSLALTILIASISSPTGAWTLWVFNSFQVPVEISLMAVLAVVLIYAAVRLLNRRPHWSSILFLATVLIVLVGSVPLFLVGNIGPLSMLNSWLTQVPAVAGARGLLLGVALGTVATGLRILMGVDRPYGG